MIEKTVKAKKVRLDDFLPGLDNGYVVEVEEDPDFRDRYNVGLAHGKVCITFHDSHGDEQYLLVDRDMPVTVRRQ